MPFSTLAVVFGSWLLILALTVLYVVLARGRGETEDEGGEE